MADSTNKSPGANHLDAPGNQILTNPRNFVVAPPTVMKSGTTRPTKTGSPWDIIKWFLFSILIGGVAGSAVAIEYYRSFSPMEKIPQSVSARGPGSSSRPNPTYQIPSTVSASVTAEPTPVLAPTAIAPAPAPVPTLTTSEIFALNDQGKISDAEASRLLSKVVYDGEGEGGLIVEAKGILDRVWAEEGAGRTLFVTLTHAPIQSLDTDGLFLLDFEEPNKATIVIPDEPTELSNGLVYAISFASLVMASAESAQDISESKYRSIYGYATDYEFNEIWNDCEQLDDIYCSLFLSYSRSPQ